jgi:hypothetical protein
MKWHAFATDFDGTIASDGVVRRADASWVNSASLGKCGDIPGQRARALGFGLELQVIFSKGAVMILPTVGVTKLIEAALRRDLDCHIRVEAS